MLLASWGSFVGLADIRWAAAFRNPGCPDPRLLLLGDARLLDHVAPPVGVTSHAVPHFFRSSSIRVDAEKAELLLQIRSGQATVDLGIEQFCQLHRKSGARANSVPARDNISGEPTLLGSRDIHQHWVAIISGCRDDPHFTRADHRLQRSKVVEAKI